MKTVRSFLDHLHRLNRTHDKGLPYFGVVVHFKEEHHNPYIASKLHYEDAEKTVEKYFNSTNGTFKNAIIFLEEPNEKAFKVREIDHPYL